MNIEIKLNSDVLPNASEQYIAVTILHETLHAYFRQTGQLDDHNEMVNNYIPWFESTLKTLYPSMSPEDAEALAYGGLTDSMAFTTSEKDAFRASYEYTSNAYATGMKGSPCTTH